MICLLDILHQIMFAQFSYLVVHYLILPSQLCEELQKNNNYFTVKQHRCRFCYGVNFKQEVNKELEMENPEWSWSKVVTECFFVGGGVCCYSIPLAYSTRSGKEHAVVQQIYIPLWLMMATDWSSTEHIFFQLHTRGSSPYLKRSLLRWDSWVASIALVDSNATSSKPFVVFISKSFTCFSPSLLPTPPPFCWYFIHLEWQPLCSHRYKSLLAICSIEKRGGIYLLWKLDGKHQ